MQGDSISKSYVMNDALADVADFRQSVQEANSEIRDAKAALRELEKESKRYEQKTGQALPGGKERKAALGERISQLTDKITAAKAAAHADGMERLVGRKLLSALQNKYYAASMVVGELHDRVAKSVKYGHLAKHIPTAGSLQGLAGSGIIGGVAALSVLAAKRLEGTIAAQRSVTQTREQIRQATEALTKSAGADPAGGEWLSRTQAVAQATATAVRDAKRYASVTEMVRGVLHAQEGESGIAKGLRTAAFILSPITYYGREFFDAESVNLVGAQKDAYDRAIQLERLRSAGNPGVERFTPKVAKWESRKALLELQSEESYFSPRWWASKLLRVVATGGMDHVDTYGRAFADGVDEIFYGPETKIRAGHNAASRYSEAKKAEMEDWMTHERNALARAKAKEYENITKVVSSERYYRGLVYQMGV